MKRIHSGIEGFDEIIGGGIPYRNVILLSGECGTGKTIFGLQFIINSEDNGVYVSFEEERDKIEEIAEEFGWDIKSLIKNDNIRILKYDPFKLEDVISVLESNIREVGAKRVVIDSITSLATYVKDMSEIRRMILQLSYVLRKNECTSILISEIVPGEKGVSRFGVEEFVTDGVVVMKRYESGQEFRRGLSILKMRGTEHSNYIHNYRITKRGITINPQPQT